MRYCPECNSETNVIATRRTQEGNIRRRRECPYCGFRYFTIERVRIVDEWDETNSETLYQQVKQATCSKGE